LLTDPKQRDHVLQNLDKLVVKAVGESGGYGMLIGPHSTSEQQQEVSRTHPGRIRATILLSPRLRSRGAMFY